MLLTFKKRKNLKSFGPLFKKSFYFKECLISYVSIAVYFILSYIRLTYVHIEFILYFIFASIIILNKYRPDHESSKVIRVKGMENRNLKYATYTKIEFCPD